MNFTNDFAVAQPIDDVWATMLSLDRVLPLIPYAKVLGGTGSKVNAQIDIRFGAVSMCYVGIAEIVERDDQTHRAVMTALAKQTNGRSSVTARVEIELTAAGMTTAGRLLSSVSVPALGPQHGQSTIVITTQRMIDDFARNLAAMYAPPEQLAA